MKSYKIHSSLGKYCIIQYEPIPSDFINDFIAVSLIDLPSIKCNGSSIYSKDVLYCYGSGDDNGMLRAFFYKLLASSVCFDLLPDSDFNTIFRLVDMSKDLEALIKKKLDFF